MMGKRASCRALRRRCALVSAALLATLMTGAVEGAETPADEFGRDTPRTAVQGYLKACRQRNYAKAAHYLDLSQTEEDGSTLARQLDVVLSRKVWIDVEGLSTDPEGSPNDGLPPHRDRLGTIESRRGKVDILLQRVSKPDGALIWQIAGVTVAQVPSLWKEFGYGVLERFLPPMFFDFQLLNIPLWQWIALLTLVFVTAVLSWLLAVIITWALRAVAGRTETAVDDRLIEGTAAPIRLAVAVVVFRLGLAPIGLPLEALEFASMLLHALFIVAMTWMLLRATDILATKVEERLLASGQSSATAAVPAGRKAVKVILLVLAFVAILDSLGFSVTALLAGLGVGGIAVALAAQKTVENLFGGITLYGDRPVRVGDFCRFGDQVGTVEEIGLRSTRVRTLDRTVVTIPNADFSNLRLENFTKRDRIRLFAMIGVRYETTPDQLRYILVEVRKLLYAHERVTPDPARIRFVGFGAFSLDLEIFAYVNTSDWNEFLGIREDIYLRIMDIIEASGTGFAFPSQTLYLGRDDAPSEQRAREVADEVKRWRERREVFLPDFPSERIAEIENTIAYPPEGSPAHRASR